MASTEFSVSADRTVKVVTGLVIILFIGITFMPLILPHGDETGKWVTIGTTILIWGTAIFSWMLHPTGYQIEKGRLLIKRPAGERSIVFNEIKEILMPEDSSMRWSLRLFGSGAFFGYFGKFMNKAFGTMTWYATRLTGFVLVRLKSGETVALTPDDSTFADQLRSAAGLA